jgi:hypothetical protein
MMFGFLFMTNEGSDPFLSSFGVSRATPCVAKNFCADLMTILITKYYIMTQIWNFSTISDESKGDSYFLSFILIFSFQTHVD